ncbi:polysaccharide deacetylase [Rhizobium sp. R72]|uniref:polysaccharide deacetylase family protein n=1 Tax=unclassified Rhizobium TaxID=2613769 RepID=UPI000B532C9C|nr:MULTISPECIES: polysaccharide deacetylase family protein [unclassified Rhizobium]OWV97531.1 polysaccharide deacetylase [Rhizobium sp. R72]OWV97870.1 polysaccharide deacetylase [Rhizobium sp. R711]
MTYEETWLPLRRELARWQSAGRRARFWLRDDDAIEPTVALESLLTITRQACVPVTIAVIPASTGQALATRLLREDHVLVAVHGWSHANHASPEEKKQELGRHRPAAVVLEELGTGFDTLQRLYGQRLVPMLVPPWNRISEELVAQLGGRDFNALSVFGRARAGSPIRLLNTHVDIVNTRRQRGNRLHSDLVAEMVAQLSARFADDEEPIGILTHHLVHDASEWEFLTQLFKETAHHAGATWTSARDLLS